MKLKNFIILGAIIIIIAVLVGGGAYFSIKQKRNKILDTLNYTKTQLDKKDYQAALGALAEIFPEVKDAKLSSEVALLLSETSLKLEKYDEAKKYAEELIKKSPKSENAEKAKLIIGEIILKTDGNLDSAEKLFRGALESKADKSVILKAKYMLAQILYKNGNLEEVKETLDELYSQEIPSDLKDQIEQTLGDTNTKLLYSRGLMEGDQLYELEKGDSIYKIARKFKMPQDLIMRCNGISDPNRLSINMRIKIPKVDFSIVVNKSDNTLTLLNNGKFFKKYTVRTGQYDHLTPVGKFKILNKKINPTWADPKTHKVYQSGDPENELGTRWMAFIGDHLGIHGTINPDSIGQYTSNGCIGMLKDDVEELFDLVPIGTPLEIIGKTKQKDSSKKGEASETTEGTNNGN